MRGFAICEVQCRRRLIIIQPPRKSKIGLLRPVFEDLGFPPWLWHSFAMGAVVKIAVVIPAFNEEANIAALIDGVNRVTIEQATLTPVVVNDCSRDATGEIVSRLNCVALHLPINLGIGGAVQTGLKYAYQHGFDLAVQIDGDGQHPPENVPLLRRELEKNSWDVVIGSRFIKNEGFQSTLGRRCGIRLLQFLLRLIIGKTVTDPTSGMRMMNRKALKAMCAFYPDEYPEPEAFVLYHRNGLEFGEVPVEMIDRSGGESSIQGLHSIYYILKVSMAVVFTYLRK
jgi:glycosyltransferase involved in cell wall biosynthesis